MDIGEYIKLKRLENGLSLRQLSDLCGVPYPSIYAIENGKKNAQFNTIEKILFSLGYEIKIIHKKK